MSIATKHNPYLAGAIVFLLISIAASTQVLYDHATSMFGKESFRFIVKHRSIIDPRIVKHTTFGFDNMIADYYWISAIQDFTGWDYKDEFYLNYFRNISAIDPRFSYPYLFAILTAANDRDPASVDKVAAIADLGIETLPNNWEIPFYLGTMYNMLNKDDVKALHYIEIAAKTDGVPPAVPITYSAITAKKILGKNTARELMTIIRDTTTSETIKQLAEHNIEIENFKNALQTAVIAYKAKHGTYPKTLEDLVKERFIDIPEAAASQFIITVDAKTGAVRVMGR